MKSRQSPEQEFHMSVASFLDYALPAHATWTTFPSGGGGRLRGAILKAMGLKPGWPDVQILVRATGYDTARSMSRFIGFELKAPDGRARWSQTERHKFIRDAGGEVYVVHTLEDIYDVLVNKEHMRLKIKPS